MIDRSVTSLPVDNDDPGIPPLKTGEVIREAAVRLFAARGYAATGIRDVAKDSGVTTAALYHHMGSKQGLLLNIMRDTMHALIADARDALREAEGPAEELHALASAHVLFNGRNQLAALVSDGEIRSLDPPNRASIVLLRDSYEELWEGVIRRGVELGAFEIADQRLYRLAVIQMVNGVTYWYVPAAAASLRSIAARHGEFALLMAGHRSDVPVVVPESNEGA